MTKEQMKSKLAELTIGVRTDVLAWNEATQGNASYEEVSKINERIAAAVEEYSTVARALVLAECAAAPDPMLEAVTRLTYDVIGVKDTVNKEKVLVRDMVLRTRQIDLLKLHTYVKENNYNPKGIGQDPQWPYMVEKLNLLLTVQRAADLGIDPRQVNDSYAISEIGRALDMGKNPASKTNLLKTINAILAAMIGYGYKATTHDVSFLMQAYARKGREKLTITVATHKQLRGYMAEIAHRIVTDDRYKLSYKTKKNVTAAAAPVAEEPKAEESTTAPVQEVEESEA